MPRVALRTLGCKVNQYETQKIAEDFQSRGFELVGFLDQADVYVINTCTVTRIADSKSRQAARSAVSRNPQAAVVLTGCYAETSPEQVRAIDGVALVVGNRGKPRLVEEVIALLGGGRRAAEDSAIRNPQSEIENRTRALLKVQDGCDQFCSYCVVPYARPVIYSKPCSEVLEEARGLASRGFREIVLTGIRLGRYEDGRADLIRLLEALADVPGIERIRLSSIELTDIREELLDLMARDGRICRHLHVPLQSGDDGVLARMSRPYTAARFSSFVREARAEAPGIAITTDIMVGFPGETEAEFEVSYSFAEEMRFARMHVFRYSPRPRTIAAELPDDVPHAEKERRSARLIELAEKCSQEFASAFIGATVPVLAEGKEINGNLRSGLTDNYLRVAFEGGSDLVGKIVNVRIESVSKGAAFGAPAER